MSKSCQRFSGAIKPAQIAQAYLPIPLQHFGIDHDHELGSIRSKFMIVI
jgi:hypothetical protein